MKNIRLRLNEEGEIIVSAPESVPFSSIQMFVDQHIDWIAEKRKTLQTMHYTEGERLSLFGEMYDLKLVTTEKKRSKIYIKNSNIIMENVDHLTQEVRKKLVHRFYATQLANVVPDMVEDYEFIMKVQVNAIKYQYMKTRWGTCHITKHLIRLNTKLAQYSHDVIESVVVHEMVHLLERGHNKRFYQLMDQYYPNWKECDAILKQKAK